MHIVHFVQVLPLLVLAITGNGRIGEPPTVQVADTLGPSQINQITPDTGTYVDPRDGESYRWTRVGRQVWMAENLRFATSEGSVCWGHDEEMCGVHGRYYTWEAARKAPPPGWHLPSDREWKTLELAVGLRSEDVDMEGDRGDEAGEAAGKLKALGQWPSEYRGHPIPVTDETRFGALPSGFFALGEFSHEGYASWWTDTEAGDAVWIRVLRFFDNRIQRLTNSKEHHFTIRCVRDEGT